MQNVYLDYASTTPVDPLVKKEMERYFCQAYGNPGSPHQLGREAHSAIEDSRRKVAKVLNCSPKEVIFTGGGTESVNLAIKGVCRALKHKGKHIITQKTEHAAVLRTCEYLEKSEGFEVTYLPVDKEGFVRVDDIAAAIRQNTILISVMYANNEVGTIQPIYQMGELARKHNIIFHSDACQAGGLLPLDVGKLNVDLLSINSSKVYGPKGVGALYIRNGTNIDPIIHGGEQEQGLRGGTENVSGIVGFAKAIELAENRREDEVPRLCKLRDLLLDGIIKSIPDASVNGPTRCRLANNLNVGFRGVDASVLVSHLDAKGISVSTGAACTKDHIKISHVLSSLGISDETAKGSIRISLGKHTTQKEIEYFIFTLSDVIQQLDNVHKITLRANLR